MPIVEGTYRRLLTADERGQLEAVIRKRSGSAALARRARRTCCLGPTASAGLTSEPSPGTAPRTGAVASVQLRWARSRCLPCNASGASSGCNPRFIATNLSGAAHSLVPGLQLGQRTGLRARPEPAVLPPERQAAPGRRDDRKMARNPSRGRGWCDRMAHASDQRPRCGAHRGLPCPHLRRCTPWRRLLAMRVK